jgi:hypothetical protein
MIKPTVGRVVWYTPSKRLDENGDTKYEFPCDGKQPLAALVAYVHSDSMVNLTVFDTNGVSHSACSVELIQEGHPKDSYGRYCEWMPYQLGQAAKTEAVMQLTAVS